MCVVRRGAPGSKAVWHEVILIAEAQAGTWICKAQHKESARSIKAKWIWALIHLDDGILMSGSEWKERSLILHLFVLVVLGVRGVDAGP